MTPSEKLSRATSTKHMKHIKFSTPISQEIKIKPEYAQIYPRGEISLEEPLDCKNLVGGECCWEEVVQAGFLICIPL